MQALIISYSAWETSPLAWPASISRFERKQDLLTVVIYIHLDRLISLVHRMAVWGQNWYIVGGLVAISLGHWSLLLHGILLTAVWVPGEGCVITSTDSKLLSATFIYSMSFDFIVLLLTASRLVRPTGTKSQLVNMMFTDGLAYFLIAYVYECLFDPRGFLTSFHFTVSSST